MPTLSLVGGGRRAIKTHTPPLGAIVTQTLVNSDKRNIALCLPVTKKMGPKTKSNIGMLKLFRWGIKALMCIVENVSG